MLPERTAILFRFLPVDAGGEAGVGCFGGLELGPGFFFTLIMFTGGSFEEVVVVVPDEGFFFTFKKMSCILCHL